MKQNGAVCKPGPALLFFIFRCENVTGTFEKPPPGRVVPIMAPPKRGTFFRLQVYEGVGISLNDGKGRQISNMFQLVEPTNIRLNPSQR